MKVFCCKMAFPSEWTICGVLKRQPVCYYSLLSKKGISEQFSNGYIEKSPRMFDVDLCDVTPFHVVCVEFADAWGAQAALRVRIRPAQVRKKLCHFLIHLRSRSFMCRLRQSTVYVTTEQVWSAFCSLYEYLIGHSRRGILIGHLLHTYWASQRMMGLEFEAVRVFSAEARVFSIQECSKMPIKRKMINSGFNHRSKLLKLDTTDQDTCCCDPSREEWNINRTIPNIFFINYSSFLVSKDVNSVEDTSSCKVSNQSQVLSTEIKLPNQQQVTSVNHPKLVSPNEKPSAFVYSKIKHFIRCDSDVGLAEKNNSKHDKICSNTKAIRFQTTSGESISGKSLENEHKLYQKDSIEPTDNSTKPNNVTKSSKNLILDSKSADSKFPLQKPNIQLWDPPKNSPLQLQAALGNAISVSEKSLENAQILYKKECVEPEKPVQNNVVLETNSSKSLIPSTELADSKSSSLQKVDMCDTVTNASKNDSLQFQTASGKTISISEKNAQRNQITNNGTKSSDRKSFLPKPNIELYDTVEKGSLESNTGSVQFQTASGKAISFSETSLENAKKLYREACVEPENIFEAKSSKNLTPCSNVADSKSSLQNSLKRKINLFQSSEMGQEGSIVEPNAKRCVSEIEPDEYRPKTSTNTSKVRKSLGCRRSFKLYPQK